MAGDGSIASDLLRILAERVDRLEAHLERLEGVIQVHEQVLYALLEPTPTPVVGEELAKLLRRLDGEIPGAGGQW